MTLDKIKSGKTVFIKQIKIEKNSRLRLYSLGVQEQKYITVLKNSKAGCVLQVGQNQVAVCKSIASKIAVSEKDYGW